MDERVSHVWHDFQERTARSGCSKIACQVSSSAHTMQQSKIQRNYDEQKLLSSQMSRECMLRERRQREMSEPCIVVSMASKNASEYALPFFSSELVVPDAFLWTMAAWRDKFSMKWNVASADLYREILLNMHNQSNIKGRTWRRGEARDWDDVAGAFRHARDGISWTHWNISMINFNVDLSSPVLPGKSSRRKVEVWRRSEAWKFPFFIPSPHLGI